jgi:tRNA A37 threonylcarbamoyladenosine modification protein TsaB
MDRDWQRGDWLLLDAAGPELVTGILRDGHWLEYEKHAGGFLESLQPGVRALLEKAGIELSSLSGVVYATGPGSTLGLRLAAMFVRTLMQQPTLDHWRCFNYNNLELACAARLDPSKPGEFMMGAPWRRDRLHRATFLPGPPPSFDLDTIAPEEATSTSLPVVALGHRLATLPKDADQLPYPSDRIPEILSDWPVLLESTTQPDLYSAEDPHFAKWTSTRHQKK